MTITVVQVHSVWPKTSDGSLGLSPMQLTCTVGKPFTDFASKTSKNVQLSEALSHCCSEVSAAHYNRPEYVLKIKRMTRHLIRGYTLFGF